MKKNITALALVISSLVLTIIAFHKFLALNKPPQRHKADKIVKKDTVARKPYPHLIKNKCGGFAITTGVDSFYGVRIEHLQYGYTYDMDKNCIVAPHIDFRRDTVINASSYAREEFIYESEDSANYYLGIMNRKIRAQKLKDSLARDRQLKLDSIDRCRHTYVDQ